MAMSAAATSALSRESSAADGSNRLEACSARSVTRWAGPVEAGGLEGSSSAARVSATARATPWVRDPGLGLPVITAIRMGLPPFAKTFVGGCGATDRSARKSFLRCGGWMAPGISRGSGRRGERGRVHGRIDAVRRRVGPQAARAQDRQDALAEPVRLLQVRVAGQDELGQAEPCVLLDPVGDLGVAADQRRPGAAAEQPDAGPQVRRDLEVVR